MTIAIMNGTFANGSGSLLNFQYPGKGGIVINISNIQMRELSIYTYMAQVIATH